MKTELIFPVLVISPSECSDAKPGDEQMDSFEEWRFSTLHPAEYPNNERPGWIVISNDGRCWKIVSAIPGELVKSGSWLVRRWRSIFRTHRRQVHQELVELDPMSLDQIKDRAIQIMRSDPDFWRDDEAIIGWKSEPRDAEDVFEERIEAVRNASSLDEIIDVLHV